VFGVGKNKKKVVENKLPFLISLVRKDGGDTGFRVISLVPGGGCLRYGTLQIVGVRESVAGCADSRLAVNL